MSPLEWASLLNKLIPIIRPSVVSVAAMEPLLKADQGRTLAILQTASRQNIPCGFVSNGIYAEQFFQQHGQDLSIDFMDISVDGPPEIDARVRGENHFGIVNQFLRSGTYKHSVNKVYISCVLTQWNCVHETLTRFLSWVKEVLEEPRLVLLLLYPNEHVDRSLLLQDESFLRVIDILVQESVAFDDIFIELFPSSLPGLAHLVERGILPSESQLARDEAGMLWGHIAENLYVRFENLVDLELYHVRISPEGYAIPPENLERANYLDGAYGNLLQEDWSVVSSRILQQSRNRINRSLPQNCYTQSCRNVCHGENSRCPLIHL